MSDFIQALGLKIAQLEDDKEVLLSKVSEIDAKISILKELQGDEAGEQPSLKKRGRPRGPAKEKEVEQPKNYGSANPDVLAEARQMEGTDPEMAARLATRKSNRSAGPVKGYGPGVRVGTKDQVLGGTGGVSPGAAHISVEDDENEPV